MGAEGSDLITDKGIFKDKDAESWEKMMTLGPGSRFFLLTCLEVLFGCILFWDVLGINTFFWVRNEIMGCEPKLFLDIVT